MASGRGGAVRDRVGELLSGPGRASTCCTRSTTSTCCCRSTVGDYVDFYSSIHHATNLGRILRPDAEPLLPNWRHLPVGYHGRAGTVVVSGTDVVRPAGPRARPGRRRAAPHADPAARHRARGRLRRRRPDRRRASRPTTPTGTSSASCCCNDWSARDIQAFEYQPLGPHLGKSFATTISPWVVTLDALRPFLVEPPEQEPRPDPYLRAARPWGLDLHLDGRAQRHDDHGDELRDDVLDLRPAARPPHRQRRDARAPATCSRRAR